jgi:kynurenine 3-monooxygenase
MPSDKPKFTIVGAGLSGALMAAYLGQAGYEVEMFEKRPDPHQAGTQGGRSINLALSTRGIQALEEVGVARQVLASAVPMRGRMMHSPDGHLTFQPYGTSADQVINSVSRGGLNMILLEAASRHPSVRLHFESNCVGADLDTATAIIQGADGRQRQVGGGGILIGSDGAFSAVRARMQRQEYFDYSQHYLSHGYKELVIPPADGGGHRLERNALHIWPRGGFMMIALPNADGSYTCTCFWALHGPASFSEVRTPGQARAFFDRVFPDASRLMPTLEADYEHNPTGSMVTVRCGPWYHLDRVVLIGDAAHAVVPFYGQGMNASFEDCTVLSRCLADCAPDYERALQTYYQMRKPNTDALADLAVGNFFEMRDHVASRWFLLKKAAGRGLHRVMPRTFIPIYSMVTFSTIPYAEAVARHRRQQSILRRLALAAASALFLLAIWWVLSYKR